MSLAEELDKGIIVSSIQSNNSPNTLTQKQINEMFQVSDKFAALNKVIVNDLNSYRRRFPHRHHFTRDDIARYLRHPERHVHELRDAVNYVYRASSHFRRIIQYFVGLSDLSYVVSPYRMEPSKDEKSVDKVRKQYRKVMDEMSIMNVKTQLPKVLTVCLREDIFYGIFLRTKDNIMIQQLPSKFCRVSTIEGGVLNVSFNFRYFRLHRDALKYFPPFFEELYQKFLEDEEHPWIELPCPEAFAVKCNMDVPHYPIPPFCGILRDVFDLEDYRDMKLARTALENYAMIVMQLGVDDEGNWVMNYEKAVEFYHNLDHVLPPEIGSVLSPMPVSKISFERTNTTDKDTVAEAEQSLFTDAGVSSLLFNNSSASANALLLSIKADQSITYGIVKNIGDAINRYIQSTSYGRKFRVSFLDCSIFTRKEVGDAYLKACQYGLPMVSYYCASQGLDPAEMETMNYLENDVLGLKLDFVPLQSSNTMSSAESAGEAGAPQKDVDELTDSGEATRERE